MLIKDNSFNFFFNKLIFFFYRNFAKGVVGQLFGYSVYRQDQGFCGVFW